MQSQAGYERLQAYGFGVDYPSDCVIEFNPRSRRNEGDIALKSPRGYKLFLSWGDLDRVKKLGGPDGHADYSLGRVKGSREAKVIDVRKDYFTVNGHRAAYRDAKLELVRRGIFFNTTRTPQLVRSFHLHCDVSSRYFVVYGPVASEKGDEQSEVMARMVRSFVCHGGETDAGAAKG